MTEFVDDAKSVARTAMAEIDEALIDDFVTVIEFLAANPQAAGKLVKDDPEVGSKEYIQLRAVHYSKARTPSLPAPPTTTPDSLLAVILESRFEVNSVDTERIAKEHRWSMSAENLVGELLERYIASRLADGQWIWCAGQFVRAVDFICRDAASDSGWKSLQVKNRGSSENSSSASIRDGTTIEKWYRLTSRCAKERWDKFPAAGHDLSEKGFHLYVREYLKANVTSDSTTVRPLAQPPDRA